MLYSNLVTSRLNEFYDRLGARIQPIGIARAVDDRRLFARLVVGLAVGATINWAILVIVQVAFDEFATAIVDGLLLLTGVVAAYFFFRTGNTAIYARVAIWASAASVLMIHVLLGGYEWSGSYMLWGISNAVLAGLWLSKRETAAVTSVYLLAGVTFAVLEPSIRTWRGVRPDPTMATINTIQIFVTTVLVTAPAVLLMRDWILDEKERSRRLMLNVLPETIADRLQVEPGPIADDHDECTLLFADLVGFSEHSREIPAQQLVAELNRIFVAFDHRIARQGGEKIKTMGDGYMAAFGVPDFAPDHVEQACRSALGFLEELEAANRDLGTDFEIRVGVATGSAVAGVIGESKFSYDVWSDTVTLASRLQDAAQPNGVLVSRDVASALGTEFDTRYVGTLDLKGPGPTEVFQLV